MRYNMALVRCERHSPPDKKRTKKNYVKSVYLVGFPDTAVICGIKNCDKPGLVWLTDSELQEYNKGRRIFELDTHTIKVKVQ